MNDDFDFSLDDILAEFYDEEATEQVPEPKAKPAVPEDIDDMVYPAPPELTPAEEAQRTIDLSELLSTEQTLVDNEGDIKGDPFEPLPPETEPVREWEGDSVEPTPDGGVERTAKHKKKKAKSPTAEVYDDPVPLSNALKGYSKQVRNMWPRLLVSFFLCLPSVYITIAAAFGLPMISFGDMDMNRWILVGLNVIVMCLCYEVVVKAAMSLTEKRITLELCVLVASVVSIVHGIVNKGGEGLPYCSITTTAFFIAQCGRYFEKSSRRRTLRAAVGKDKTYSVIRQDDGFQDGPGFFKTTGDVEGFVGMTEAGDYAEKVFSIYGLAALILSLVFAGVCLFLKKSDFLSCFTVCLMAGIPAAGALCFHMPFAYLSKRLSRLGAGLGGWAGAKAATGEAGLIVTDNDLFPKGFVSIEKLNLCSHYPENVVLGYTTALIMAAESCLSEIFSEMLEEEKAVMPFLDTFQTYEGGGLSAEMDGNQVFVGTARFMTLQNTKVPNQYKAKHGVYVAINRQLAGIFVLNYKPTKAAAYTMRSMMRSKGLKTVMATRDFNITPTFMRQNFSVNCDNIEVPVVEQRVELSETDAPRLGSRIAVVTKEGLAPFGDAIVGGRRLYKLTKFNTIFSVIGGALGLVLMFYLSFMGAATVSAAGYVLIYALAWALPVLLVSAWANKY